MRKERTFSLTVPKTDWIWAWVFEGSEAITMTGKDIMVVFVGCERVMCVREEQELSNTSLYITDSYVVMHAQWILEWSR